MESGIQVTGTPSDMNSLRDDCVKCKMETGSSPKGKSLPKVGIQKTLIPKKVLKEKVPIKIPITTDTSKPPVTRQFNPRMLRQPRSLFSDSQSAKREGPWRPDPNASYQEVNTRIVLFKKKHYGQQSTPTNSSGNPSRMGNRTPDNATYKTREPRSSNPKSIKVSSRIPSPRNRDPSRQDHSSKKKLRKSPKKSTYKTDDTELEVPDLPSISAPMKPLMAAKTSNTMHVPLLEMVDELTADNADPTVGSPLRNLGRSNRMVIHDTIKNKVGPLPPKFGSQMAQGTMKQRNFGISNFEVQKSQRGSKRSIGTNHGRHDSMNPQGFPHGPHIPEHLMNQDGSRLGLELGMYPKGVNQGSKRAS